jgi:hypothetical protein
MPNNATFSPWRNTVRENGTIANPDGRAWVDGTQTQDQLEMSIHFDDAGLIPTMLCVREDGKTEEIPIGSFVGQTFTAKGSSVLMVTWLCGNDASTNKYYAVSIHNGVSNGVVYMLDTRNGVLGGWIYDQNQKRLVPIPPIDVARLYSASRR